MIRRTLAILYHHSMHMLPSRGHEGRIAFVYYEGSTKDSSGGIRRNTCGWLWNSLNAGTLTWRCNGLDTGRDMVEGARLLGFFGIFSQVFSYNELIKFVTTSVRPKYT